VPKQLSPINSTDLFTTTASWIPKLSCALLLTICSAMPCWATSAEIVGNPSVNGDKVTIRIKVKQKDGKPVMDLSEDSFNLLVDGKPVTFKSKDWKSAREATPPPVWVVFLLDYSGSMKGKDTKGTTKIVGAINAIRQFNEAAAKRSSTTKVSIVPFGEGATDCNRPVTPTEIGDFLPANDAKLGNELDNLQSGNPCASTNIYDPVTETVKFLTNPPKESSLQPVDGSEVQPRLVVVLLSDGYHNKPKEEADFERLMNFLRRQDSVSIHTLGYGLTQEELGRKYGLGRRARRSDVGEKKKVPEAEFVDQDKLTQIANTTGGIAEFSPDAKTVSEKLDVFLSSILGEYEISYTEPNPERGSKHDIKVEVKTATEVVNSEPKNYLISVFGRPVSWQKRLFM
jgi:VWFA-related protein